MPQAPDSPAGRRRNLTLLVAAQALGQSASITSVSVSGLAGAMLAPDPALATLPFALITVGIALSTLPVSFLMEATSRRTGFLLGALSGLIAAALALTALYQQSFWLFCLASPFQGVFQATTLYYRYGAVEAAKAGADGDDNSEGVAGRAISLVLVGGVIAALLAPTAARYANGVIDVTAFAGPYALMMGLSLAVIIPLSLLRLPPVVAHHEDEDGDENEGGRAARPLITILTSPPGLTAVICSLTAWSIMVFLMSGVPLAMKGLGYGYADSSIVIQWHVLAMYVPSFFTGRLIARVGLVPVLLAGIGALAAALVSGYSAGGMVGFAVSLALVGLGWNFLYIGGTTLLTQAHRETEKAKTQGANEFLSFGVSAIGAISSGWVVANYGWPALNMASASILFLALAAVIGYAIFLRRGADKAGLRPAKMNQEKDMGL